MKELRNLVKKLAVPSGRRVRLRKYDPTWTGSLKDEDKGRTMLQQGVKRLSKQQALLYAQDTYSVLVVFQAMDAAGKDGAIRHVLSGVNPQGCQVFSFKAPSAEERDHDYLWRSMKALPGARAHRHSQPLVLRRGPRRPRAQGDPRLAAAAGVVEGRGHLEAPLPGDLRIRAVPARQRRRS